MDEDTEVFMAVANAILEARCEQCGRELLNCECWEDEYGYED